MSDQDSKGVLSDGLARRRWARRGFKRYLRCDRCGKRTTGTIMSMFNTDDLCHDCKESEKAHPRYEEARRAEAEACQQNNYNFEGIGLPSGLHPRSRFVQPGDGITVEKPEEDS